MGLSQHRTGFCSVIRAASAAAEAVPPAAAAAPKHTTGKAQETKEVALGASQTARKGNSQANYP